MKHRLLRMVFGLMALLMSPALALAEEEDVVYARLQNYEKSITVEGSTMLSWLLFGFLAVICMAVLFKNAKRTHLD